MKKIALLAEVSFMTRVVIDVPDDFNEETDSFDEMYDQIANEASPQLIERINNGETLENITYVDSDNECPYGTFNEEK